MSAAAHPGRRDRGALNYSTTRACDRVPSTGPAAAFFEWRPLNWLVDLMGGLVVLVLSWLLFPAAVTSSQLNTSTTSPPIRSTSQLSGRHSKKAAAGPVDGTRSQARVVL